MALFSTMTLAEAITAVRASSGHDNDTQVTDAQITARLDREYRRTVRWLLSFAPSLGTTETVATLAAGVSTYAKSSLTRFDKLVRIEKQLDGGDYYPIDVTDDLNVNCPSKLIVYELPASFEFRPAANAPGTYRIAWCAMPASPLTSLAALPTGCEDIPIERVAAWVRQRHDERAETKWHEDEARRIEVEQRRMLIRRYGVHPKPGLIITRT
jgi:hypothetical protein